MTITETLKAYDPTLKIKIGSVDGDGFWFCGTVGYVRQSMEAIDTKIKAYHRKRVAKAKKNLQECLNREPSPLAYLRAEMQKLDPEPTARAYMETLNAYFSHAVRLQNTVKSYERTLYRVVDFADREVVECEMADPEVDEDTVRLIVEGAEKGTLWMTNEAKTIPCYFFRNETEGDV